MANDLVKEKKLKSYVPGTAADPGFPGVPAMPAQVLRRKVTREFVQTVNAMRIYFKYATFANEGGSTIIGAGWITPLEELRAMVARPTLTAKEAHYSERIGTLNTSYGDLTMLVLLLSGVKFGPDIALPVWWTSAWIRDVVTEITIIPATPAIPARPPKAGTPARYTYDYQSGWLGVARSVRELRPGWVGTVTFDVGVVVGAVVGFVKKPGTKKISDFGLSPVISGVAVGDGAITLVQDGARSAMAENQALVTGMDSVKAVVAASGVEWFVNDQFLGRTSLSTPGDFVLYSSLYQGDDAVLNPVITDGIAPEPMDQNTGKGTLHLRALNLLSKPLPRATLQLRPLTLLASDYKVMQGELKLRSLRAGNTPVPRGAMRIPPMRVRSSSAKRDGAALGLLRGLQSDGFVMREDWVPKYSMGTLFVPPVSVFGVVRGGQNARVEMIAKPFISSASEREHAEGVAVFRPFASNGEGELLTNLVKCLNFIGQVDVNVQSVYLSLSISERVGLSCPVVSAAVISVDVSSKVGINELVEISTTIIEQAIEELGAGLKHTALLFKLLGDKIIPVEQGSAWAVNTATNASTRYENYAFNSFMAIGGRHFGVQPRGVYLLEGSSDSGQSIASGVNLGKQDFGTQALKHVAAVHAGVSAKGTLFLRVGDGRDSWTYRARRVDERMRTQRFDPGRGIRTSYFDFELVSEGEFELDSVTFQVVASQRRI